MTTKRINRSDAAQIIEDLVFALETARKKLAESAVLLADSNPSFAGSFERHAEAAQAALTVAFYQRARFDL